MFYTTRLADGYGAEEVIRETKYLGNFDTIIDRLKELFDRWERQGTFPPVVQIEMLYRARLAAHEWIAHLVQYADFEDRVPQIALSVWVEDEKLWCLIADNSQGFPLELYQNVTLVGDYEVMVKCGMGWLIIQACTDHLAYCLLGNLGFVLEFSISG